ncbi:ABH_G0027260.mRNA.1.CDS.1 [Saccharomyces cerevisiae]|nr:ABH_G0027260.mRNA.1.CDS.1 [Saccharomyces cerevisiae]CAI6593765.1 ABH_G0027260.mRNA.1.CDS.1 [Saccharomyces cerevisiae]
MNSRFAFFQDRQIQVQINESDTATTVLVILHVDTRSLMQLIGLKIAKRTNTYMFEQKIWNSPILFSDGIDCEKF